MNNRIIVSLCFIAALFLSLITYLLYFNLFEAKSVALNPYNKRQLEDESNIMRGNIYDAKHIALAQTLINKDGTFTRDYPHKNIYSHIIGYTSVIYGKYGLEMKYNNELLNKNMFSFVNKETGNDLTLTIIHELQKYAYNEIKKGSIIAIEPKTGKILCMVSKPDFNPNEQNLKADWSKLVDDETSPLLARSTQGLYPPGSVFKIVTAAAAYENGMSAQTFEDTGKFNLGNRFVENDNGKVYGTIDLKKGFTVSSNFVFCTLGEQLGKKLKDTAYKFGVDRTFDFDLPLNKSTINYKNMANADSALVAIGQGKTLVTPLQIALIGSAIANNGIIMKPYILESVTGENGYVTFSHRPQELYKSTNSEVAAYIKDLMISVVDSSNGTGRGAGISGIKVAGKTGTAENEQTVNKKGAEHAWFVGFAPANDPKIVVVVMLENSGGSGGSLAAPIAKKIINKYLLL